MRLLIDRLNVPHHPHATHQRRDVSEDHFHVLLLADEVIGSGFQRLQQHLAVLLPRQDQQSQLLLLPIRPRTSLPADRKAIHLRHDHIDDGDMKRLAFQQFQTGWAGSGGGDLKAAAAQLLGNDLGLYR